MRNRMELAITKHFEKSFSFLFKREQEQKMRSFFRKKVFKSFFLLLKDVVSWIGKKPKLKMLETGIKI